MHQLASRCMTKIGRSAEGVHIIALVFFYIDHSFRVLLLCSHKASCVVHASILSVYQGQTQGSIHFLPLKREHSSKVEQTQVFCKVRNYQMNLV